MFSRTFCLFLVTVALSSSIAQAAPASCPEEGSATNHTISVANRASESFTGNRSGSRTGTRGGRGRGSNQGGNNGTTSASVAVKTHSASATSVAPITSSTALSGKGNGGGNGSNTTSTGSSGNGNRGGNSSNTTSTGSSGNGNGGGNNSNTTSTGSSGNGNGGGNSSNTTSTGSSGNGNGGGNSSNTTSTGSSGASTGNNGNSNPQTSLTLDPRVICTGFENNGQGVPNPGQVASLTSSDNFINFCLTSTLPLTNGSQVRGGSCNPAPMGLIPSVNNMPSAKFVFPSNFGTIQAHTNFTVQMAIQGMETGFFVNAEQNYFAAPQQLNSQGQIQGHSHIVIEELSSLNQTTPTNPQKFAFFKGLNAAAQNGVLSAVVAGGLPAGVYKVSSINTAANHQPVLVPIAQHGSLDDVVYFTVTAGGNPASGSTGSTSSSGSTTVSSSSGKNSTSPASGSAGSSSGSTTVSSSSGKNSTSSAVTSATASASKSVAAAGATQTGKNSGGQKTNSGTGSASSGTRSGRTGNRN